MNKIQFLLVLAVLLSMTLTSCGGKEAQPDYAGIIAGIYVGTVTTGTSTVPGSSELIKRSETKIDMAIIAGSHNLDINGVGVSCTGGDVYSLSYTIAGNSLDGKVEGNILTYTLTSGALNGTFTGIRQ